MATYLEELAGIRFGNRLVVVLTTYHANALLKIQTDELRLQLVAGRRYLKHRLCP